MSTVILISLINIINLGFSLITFSKIVVKVIILLVLIMVHAAYDKFEC